MTKKGKHKVIVSVINDLYTDHRVHKTCLTLHEMGFDVLLVGRLKKDSLSLEKREYSTKRMKLLFEKGVLFYLEYNFRLLLFLLLRKKILLVSNDLDTLLPNYISSKLNGAVLVYDSHEIFCEVPELIHSPLKKKTWESLEKFIVPKLKYCITVNQSIANWFTKKYNIPFEVVRNIPNLTIPQQLKTRKELNLPENKKIILLQGAGINIQRGAEEAVEAMQYIDNAILLIIGGGDVFPILHKKIAELKLKDKVFILGKKKHHELFHYTANADIGLTIDKDTNINYKYSLPNKIFDYINAGIPIIASSLIEVKQIIELYEIGSIIENHNPKHIADKINELLYSSNYLNLKKNTKKAAMENNWEKERETLIKIFKKTLSDIEEF